MNKMMMAKHILTLVAEEWGRRYPPPLKWETDREDAGDAPVFAEVFKDYYARD